MKVCWFSVFALLFTAEYAFSEETVIATEVQECFYADGHMKCEDGSFVNTYHRSGDRITRSNVLNLKTNEDSTDNTVYQVIGSLTSDPRNNPGGLLPQVTRAIGFPGSDAVEILSISRDYIQSVKSTSDYFVVSRFKVAKD